MPVVRCFKISIDDLTRSRSKLIMQTDVELGSVSERNGEQGSMPPAEGTAGPREAHRTRSSRRRRPTRSRSTARSGSIRYEKALLHFGAAHILLGIVCILLQVCSAHTSELLNLIALTQMVQFTNHSILSESQPGLWCGTVFAITGSVCIALARTTGVYRLFQVSMISIRLSQVNGFTASSPCCASPSCRCSWR